MEFNVEKVNQPSLEKGWAINFLRGPHEKLELLWKPEPM